MSVNQELPSLTPQERLRAYQLITDGCQHIWGRTKIGEHKGHPIWAKGRFKEDKAKEVLRQLIPLTKNDPYFLAHLTSYVIKKDLTKDIQTMLTYVATLSDADGTPFSPGSTYRKPNLRKVGLAALMGLDPILAGRVAFLSHLRYSVDNYLNEAAHHPFVLDNALQRYIRFREQNPQALRGLVKAGLKHQFTDICRLIHYNLSDEAREILRWPRRGVKLEAKTALFEGLDDLAIAEKIRTDRMSYFATIAELGQVGKKISPVIAVALLEQVSPDQAVVHRSTFEDAGVLKDEEVFKLFTEKIGQAKKTLDRVDNIAKEASEEVKKVMEVARSEVNKEKMAGLGKIFLSLDCSQSMDAARDYAMERGTIIAELVNNPRENFNWGWFSDRGHLIELPDSFERDAFAQKLYGQGDHGGTDCLALYDEARKFGANIDVYLTDQEQVYGEMTSRIKLYHDTNPEVVKPQACLIIQFPNGRWPHHDVKEAYEANGIPVVEIKPESLSSTAQLADMIKVAMQGPLVVIDEIMATELLELPDYFFNL